MNLQQKHCACVQKISQIPAKCGNYVNTHTHTHTVQMTNQYKLITNDWHICSYEHSQATVRSRNQECVTGQLGSGQLTQAMKRCVSKLTQRNVNKGNYLSLTSQHCAFVISVKRTSHIIQCL